MKFNVGQYVVYRNYKVCQIEAIKALKFASKNEMQYYILRPCFAVANETIYVPLDVDAPIRNVITKSKVTQHLRKLKQLPLSAAHEHVATKRETRYRQMLESDDFMSRLYLFKELYCTECRERQKRKKLCVMDKRYKEKVENILSEEIAVALNETPSESKKRLYAALN